MAHSSNCLVYKHCCTSMLNGPWLILHSQPRMGNYFGRDPKLSATFNYARMEAVKRGSRVSVCSAGNSSYTSCGSSNQWPQGWLIFTDANNNNDIDSSNVLVKTNEALPNGTAITSNQSVVSVRWNRLYHHQCSDNVSQC